MKQISLRPHDVVVALQLIIAPQETYARLSSAIGLSASEVHEAVKRLRISRLIGAGNTRRIEPRALEEFLIYGVPYAFPGELGAATRGVPTAHSAPSLKEHFDTSSEARSSAEDVLVWPHEDGQARGTSITPLYGAAAATAKSNPPLYELLTLVDALRVGRARERRLAKSMLSHALNEQYA